MPPLLSANSVDSWDFGVTINSPTSLYRRHVLEEFVSAEDEQLRNANLPFEMDEDQTSRFYVASEPWADDTSAVEDADNEQEAISSSSQSSFVSTGPALSQTSSQRPPNTESAPSSYASSSIPEHERSKAADSLLSSSQPSLSSVEHHTHNTLIGKKSVLPSHSQSTPIRAGPRNIGSTGTPTLWSKLKSNVKRPSTSADGDTYDGSPRSKEKEKGMLNAMFSGAGKSILSQRSSRSLATCTFSIPRWQVSILT
jgi:serine/threonine-protein kinase OSR1/STK39